MEILTAGRQNLSLSGHAEEASLVELSHGEGRCLMSRLRTQRLRIHPMCMCVCLRGRKTRLITWFRFRTNRNMGYVPFQGLDPSKAVFVGRLSHSVATKAVPIHESLQDFFKCSRQMCPSFIRFEVVSILHGPSFSMIHCVSKRIGQAGVAMVDHSSKSNVLHAILTEVFYV
ncbi:hypothetical protein CHARACLAT_032782 [Characodon lateralis]|uniref:Uncharacterized protein n=1 Tax=Characodon lateralis TaxID=208331 RepID=A0ABU7D4H8_9TELE|nr:hypothetical protein [Characodon lateralis]